MNSGDTSKISRDAHSPFLPTPRHVKAIPIRVKRFQEVAGIKFRQEPISTRSPPRALMYLMCLFQAQTLAIPESIIMEMNELKKTCVVGEGKGREGKGRGLGKEEVEMHAQANKQTSKLLVDCVREQIFGTRGLISADRRTKPTLMLTIPRPLSSRLQGIYRSQRLKLWSCA